MIAAPVSHLSQRPLISTMLLTGAKSGLRLGTQMGLLRFLTAIPSELQPISGFKSWFHWLTQSEHVLAEYLRTVPASRYLKNAAYEGFLAFLRTFLENITSELIIGYFPWLETYVLHQLEYLWRGLQGRTLRPADPTEIDLPATNKLYAESQLWAPICHPVVEYAKPSSTWTPRMFAAMEASKYAIPAISIFAVSAAFDIVSFLRGRMTGRRLVTCLWKDFYGGVGAFLGVGAFASIWAVASSRLLPMFPLRAHKMLPGLFPQIGMVIGAKIMVSVVFNSIWGFDDTDEDLPPFADGAALERQRRYMLYGPQKSKFARPAQLAPVSPEFIDPDLNREFVATVFPERLAELSAKKDGEQADENQKNPSADDREPLDGSTRMKYELHRARKRAQHAAVSSRPLSRIATPTASQFNSDDEEDSEESDSESVSDSSSAVSSESSSSDSSSAESSSSESESSDDED